MFDDQPAPSTMSSTNLAAMSIDERDNLLQMLEQESTVGFSFHFELK